MIPKTIPHTIANQPTAGEEGEGGEKPAPTSAKAPEPLQPLDSVLSVSAIIGAFNGPGRAKEALAAQLNPSTAVSHHEYMRALVADRPTLQAALGALMSEHRISALVYPTTSAPALPPGGGGLAEDAVDWAGALRPAEEVYGRATALAAAAGWPSLTLPVGMTKPKPGAVAGTAAAERLPVGLSLMAPAGQDGALLRLGQQVQALQSLLPDPIAMRRWGRGVTQQ